MPNNGENDKNELKSGSNQRFVVGSSINYLGHLGKMFRP